MPTWIQLSVSVIPSDWNPIFGNNPPPHHIYNSSPAIPIGPDATIAIKADKIDNIEFNLRWYPLLHLPSEVAVEPMSLAASRGSPNLANPWSLPQFSWIGNSIAASLLSSPSPHFLHPSSSHPCGVSLIRWCYIHHRGFSWAAWATQ